MSNRTKVGDVYLTYKTKKGSRLVQLVNIDPLCLNSDVVVVYDSSVTLDMLLQAKVNNFPIEFYMHTSVNPGLKQGLWSKVGKATVPDIAGFVFKTFQPQEVIDIGIEVGFEKPETSEYWNTWTPLDKEIERVDKLSGKRLVAEQGDVFPPKDLIYRIENGNSEFKFIEDLSTKMRSLPNTSSQQVVVGGLLKDICKLFKEKGVQYNIEVTSDEYSYILSSKHYWLEAAVDNVYFSIRCDEETDGLSCDWSYDLPTEEKKWIIDTTLAFLESRLYVYVPPVVKIAKLFSVSPSPVILIKKSGDFYELYGQESLDTAKDGAVIDKTFDISCLEELTPDII